MTEFMRIGFLPLVDAALPILARELGFAEEQGLSLELVRDMSWATVRDRLVYGRTDAAHMLAPLALASTLGLERPAAALSVPFVLGLNGNAVTLSHVLADEVAPSNGLADPIKAGRRMATVARERAAARRKLRLGVVHRYSSHHYMLQYWLLGSGAALDDIEFAVVAPPFAADALGAGEIDGICVGEPWNSVAVDRGVGRIVTVTSRLWRRGVEKVLAMRSDALDADPGRAQRLVRALSRAGEAFVDPALLSSNAALLASAPYLDGSAALIERAMSDRIVLRAGAAPTHIPDFMFQCREAANFPWVSQAAWLYAQMVEAGHLVANEPDYLRAQRVFRPDVYRAALAGTGLPLPGARSKLEGGVSKPLAVGTTQGALTLGPDSFFDGRQFDPDRLEDYLAGR